MLLPTSRCLKNVNRVRTMESALNTVDRREQCRHKVNQRLPGNSVIILSNCIQVGKEAHRDDGAVDRRAFHRTSSIDQPICMCLTVD